MDCFRSSRKFVINILYFFLTLKSIIRRLNSQGWIDYISYQTIAHGGCNYGRKAINPQFTATPFAVTSEFELTMRTVVDDVLKSRFLRKISKIRFFRIFTSLYINFFKTPRPYLCKSPAQHRPTKNNRAKAECHNHQTPGHIPTNMVDVGRYWACFSSIFSAVRADNNYRIWT